MSQVRNRHSIGSGERSRYAINIARRGINNERGVADAEKRLRVRGRLRGRSRSTDLAIGGVILLATAAAIILYWETGARVAAARSRNQEAAARVEQLQIEAERVENEIHKLKTDRGYLEAVARLELGFVRAGDVVIKLDSGGIGVQTREVSTERRGAEPRGAEPMNRAGNDRANTERASADRATSDRVITEMRTGKKTGVDSASRGGL